MDGLTKGRMVHYVFTEDDAKAINRRYKDAWDLPKRIAENLWPMGAQAHFGNDAQSDEHQPAVIVEIFDGEEAGTCNLKVLLDGNDNYWATSRMYSEQPKPGTWHWIEKA